jgi:uncharacterized MAPEG superfamily protein
MTAPFVCLLIVIFLPYVFSTLSGYFKFQQFGTLDNKYPRVQGAQLEGIGARAWAAQANAWEAAAVFTAAVMTAQFAGVGAGGAAATTAIVFVVVRILHAIFYVTDKASLRSLAFIIGLGCCIRLFYLAASA